MYTLNLDESISTGENWIDKKHITFYLLSLSVEHLS